MHLTLHNHNHHYPSLQTSPFSFGDASPKSTSQVSAPSTQWREEGPYILLGYLQFVFNTSLVFLALYLLTSFVYMLSSDIADRTKEYSTELQQEIMHCSEMYVANRCTPSERVPAMDRQCKEWEFCMVSLVQKKNTHHPSSVSALPPWREKLTIRESAPEPESKSRGQSSRGRRNIRRSRQLFR